jgi:hypothetical protein
MIRESTSLWKGFDNMDKILRRAYTNTFIRVWYSTQPENIEFDSFWNWLHDDQGDRTFQTNVILWFDIIPALALIQKGIRNGQHRVYAAGVKFLMTLVIQRGHSNYVPLIIRDFLQVEKLYPEPLLDLFKEYFSMNGQGYDFNLEEAIKNLKHLLCGDSQLNYEVAAVMLESQKLSREYFFRDFKIHQSERYRDAARLPTELSDQIHKAEIFLWQNNSCVKIPKRDSIVCCDGTTALDDSCSLFDLLEGGKIHVERYVKEMIEKRVSNDPIRPSLPKVFWLSSNEQSKKKKQKID